MIEAIGRGFNLRGTTSMDLLKTLVDVQPTLHGCFKRLTQFDLAVPQKKCRLFLQCLRWGDRHCRNKDHFVGDNACSSLTNTIALT